MNTTRVRPILVAILAAQSLFTGNLAFGADEKAESPSTKPNVLLITVDTLRPDALGWIGKQNSTPTLDSLAGEGFRFPAAVSPVPLTLPAHTSLMTGVLPRRHGISDNGQTFQDAIPTLAERLRNNGFSTAAFVSGYPLESIFGLDRGFQHYDDTMPHGSQGWVERRGQETTSAALAWIHTASSPWFVWVHYYDPHDPYDPPRSFWRPGSRGRYDGEVAYTDWCIETLLDGIDPVEKENLLTVFTSDHGEGLGEHLESTHGFFIYDSTILVPLVFHYPGSIAGGESRSAARLVDVAPTMLELLELEPLTDTDGTSLLRILQGDAAQVPPAHVETRLPWIFYGWSPLEAIRSAGWKLIVAPEPELYDLRSDPGETRNVYAERPDQVDRLMKFLEDSNGSDVRNAAPVADPEALANLRALGYLGAGAPDSPAPEGLPDPKNRIELKNRLQAAERALRTGDFSSAMVEFDAVLEVEPTNRFATLRSGVAALNSGDLAGAIKRLKRSVELDPDRAEARFALGDALMRVEEFDQALPQWQAVTRLQPRRFEGWFNLGAVAWLVGHQADSARALSTAAELSPRDPMILASLARAEHATGQKAEAKTHIRSAMDLADEASIATPGAFGVILVELGHHNEAGPWLEQARSDEREYAQARIELARLQLHSGDRTLAVRTLSESGFSQADVDQHLTGDSELGPLIPDATKLQTDDQ